jgi:hypothetical protein
MELMQELEALSAMTLEEDEVLLASRRVVENNERTGHQVTAGCNRDCLDENIIVLLTYNQ